ncbi:MAG: DUF411 domain-containing protein [Gemmatimonadaceae bacterium]
MSNMPIAIVHRADSQEACTRRSWVLQLAAATLVTMLTPLEQAASALMAPAAPNRGRAGSPVGKPTPILVYRTPTCGCCKGWIAHLEKQGFAPRIKEVPNLDALKKRLGIPGTVVSCHTAVIAGYSVEGHVPAAAIRKLLRERPAIAGIGVTGMPLGSPGMEGLGRMDPFDVMAFDRKGRTSVFARFG